MDAEEEFFFFCIYFFDSRTKAEKRERDVMDVARVVLLSRMYYRKVKLCEKKKKTCKKPEKHVLRIGLVKQMGV